LRKRESEKKKAWGTQRQQTQSHLTLSLAALESGLRGEGKKLSNERKDEWGKKKEKLRKGGNEHRGKTQPKAGVTMLFQPRPEQPKTRGEKLGNQAQAAEQKTDNPHSITFL